MLNEREKAKEILTFNDGQMIPKYDSTVNTFLRYIVLGSTIFAILLLIMGVNLGDMSLSAKIAYFSALGYVLKIRGHVRVPQPMEIWFFDDYLIFYNPKRMYKKSHIRREFEKFYYKDIHKIEHRTKINKFVIYGIYEGIYYKYKKNSDEINTTPCYHKTVDSVNSIYLNFANNVDILGAMEKYTGKIIEKSES